MANRIIEVVFQYSRFGSPSVDRALNVLHFMTDQVPADTSTIWQTAADQISLLWATSVKQVMSSDYAYQGCLVQWLTATARAAGWNSVAGQGPGAIDVPYSSLQNCLNLKKRTARAGRSNRGRIYVPGVPEAYFPNGILAPDYKTAVEAAGFGSTLVQDILIPGVDPVMTWKCVVARSPWSDSFAVSQPVTVWEVDPVIRAQRRRQPGRGY